MYSTLVALVHNTEPIIGVNDAPMLGDRFAGAVADCDANSSPGYMTMNGKIVYPNHQYLHGHHSQDLEQVSVYATTPFMFEKAEEWRAFTSLAHQCHAAVFGCDGYAYGLCAAGLAGVVAEAGLKVHDVLTHAAIVKAAGGELTSWAGSRITWRWSNNNNEEVEKTVKEEDSENSLQVVASASHLLHKRALGYLQQRSAEFTE